MMSGAKSSYTSKAVWNKKMGECLKKVGPNATKTRDGLEKLFQCTTGAQPPYPAVEIGGAYETLCSKNPQYYMEGIDDYGFDRLPVVSCSWRMMAPIVN